MESKLVRMCIEAATESGAAVEKWRRQRRTLERMPSHLAEALLHHLLRRRLLFPSLLEVFKYSIEEIDLRGESCVDAEWMAYLGAFRYLRSMVLADCQRINNSAFWNITGMTSLTEVDLSRCSKITDAGVRHLLSVPALAKLCISETSVTANGIALLGSLTNLLVLDLGGLPVTDSALKSLKALTKLQHLDIWGSEVSNDGADLLKMYPSLSFLNLAWTYITELPILSSLTCLNMSNCTIQHLSEEKGHRPRMEKLILSGATINNVSEAFQYIETSRLDFLDLSHASLNSFCFLRSMNALTHLNLSNSSLIDNSVECIAYVGANLIYLNLSNTKITSDGIGALAGHVPNLETILLSGTAIDDTAVSYISMMPSLKVINLNSTNVKGLIHQMGNVPDVVPSFAALKDLRHLERLDLEEINVQDAALFPLASFGRLSYLSLRSVSLTDASLYHVSSVPNLIYLGFCDAVLTSAGLDCVNLPQTLEVLDMRGCWLLTIDVLIAFCQKHSQIEVKHELVDTLDKRDFRFSSPSRITTGPSKCKHKSKLSMSPLRSDEIFLDQRLKYTREELLALQFSTSTLQGNS
ncbi:hypothetical protein ACJIZ3_001885 [Penstemon smallii]|uniref:Uncharacterized protein n=1 Tax=Penstemon smallii TaxID=265156 RepID=A0ABD3U5Z0_9LAMI